MDYCVIVPNSGVLLYLICDAIRPGSWPNPLVSGVRKNIKLSPRNRLSIRTTLRVVLHFSIPPTLLTTATLSNQNKDAEVALNERVFHRRLRREMKEFRGASESYVKGYDETG